MLQSQSLNSDFLGFIKHLFVRQISAFLIIVGRRGSGKTDLALFITEILKELDVIKHFSTNIKIYESPFPILEITNLDDLRFWAQNNTGRKLFIFDEIGKAMPRRKPMATLTVELLNEFQILRKYKLSIIATTITEAQTDGAILDPRIIDGFFEKPNYKNPKLAYYTDTLEDLTKDMREIPRTNIHFDTYSSAPFTKHGEKRRPTFKTEELEKLWDYAHGVTYKDLGVHPQQMARIIRKYLKEVMERDIHSSP